MSDAIPRADAAAGAGLSAASLDRKIEELLLAGLDQYFAGQYEQAINVWTRALFLDRNHARARAYIERARAALAERQRESEELLQNGVDAFQRGDGPVARRLIRDAIDSGAPAEEALSLLDRLDRIDHGPLPAPAAARTPTRVEKGLPPHVHERHRLGRGTILALAGLVLLAVTWLLLVNWPFRAVPRGPAGDPVAGEPLSLPLPRRGELALARARALAGAGRLHDALTALDEVRATDAQRVDADRLRAELQRQLLDLDRASAPRGPVP